MARSIYPTVTIACTLLLGSACSRKDEPPKRDLGGIDWTRRNQLLSAAPIAEPPPTVPVDPSLCPKTETWSKLDTFAPACGYVWTKETAKLPPAPQWGFCDASLGIRPSACKQLNSNGRLKAKVAGLATDGTVQIGFVEDCLGDQIVLADIDGPTRFALRASGAKASPSACEMQLLAIDMGKWLAALGSEKAHGISTMSTFTVGGGIVGGNVGELPSILFSQSSQMFHVATTQGTILPDGWISDGKRQYWNGKPFERPIQPHFSRLTKKLLLNKENWIYVQSQPEPKLLLRAGEGRYFDGFRRRDKQLVWQEVLKERGHETCFLVAGELDKYDVLTKARRLTEIPCTSQPVVVGCNSALISNDLGLFLVSLENGSTRRLGTKGSPLALGCKEALIDRSNTLLRMNRSAFGPEKAPDEPPSSLSVQSMKTEADAGIAADDPDTIDGGHLADAQP